MTFPVHAAYQCTAWSQSVLPPDFQQLFARVLKPSDIAHRHIEALNVEFLPECSAEELVSPGPDGTSYFPKSSSSQPANTGSYSDAIKLDPVVDKKRKDFEERLLELQIDNDTAFRVITKSTKLGVKPPRLGYMRKFWEALEIASQYWDSSLDQYYESHTAHLPTENGTKRPRLDALNDSADITTGHSTAKPFTSAGSGQNTSRSTTEPAAVVKRQKSSTAPEADIDTPERADRSGSVTPEPSRPRLCYKGRRNASGRDMPDRFRLDIVRAFVEGVVWPFRCSVGMPRLMPILQVGNLNLPIRQSAAVYRTPPDRTRARQGWLEGPIFGLQVRADTEFESESLSPDARKTKARLDLIRELGGLVLLAQERSRQGKTEVKPGEGKWWTTKPRWGGGSGAEAQNDIGNTDVLQMASQEVGAGSTTIAPKEKASSALRKKTPAMLWKELKCGSGVWDPRTDYQAIGKHPDSAYDEVWSFSFFLLIFTINHIFVSLHWLIMIRFSWCLPSTTTSRFSN